MGLRLLKQRNGVNRCSGRGKPRSGGDKPRRYIFFQIMRDLTGMRQGGNLKIGSLLPLGATFTQYQLKKPVPEVIT
jgi:hypothetical protein